MELLNRPDGAWFAVLLWLSTWRLTYLFMYETGPYRIVVKIREWAGVVHDEEDYPIAYTTNSVFECFLCLSFWVACVALLVGWFAWGALLPFALSGAAIWAQKAYSRGSR